MPRGGRFSRRDPAPTSWGRDGRSHHLRHHPHREHAQRTCVRRLCTLPRKLTQAFVTWPGSTS
jgi:hypothetical protein